MKKLTKQYVVSTYSDGSVRVTERALTKRDTYGRFKSDYTPSLRLKRMACEYAPICPFRASTSIEEL